MCVCVCVDRGGGLSHSEVSCMWLDINKKSKTMFLVIVLFWERFDDTLNFLKMCVCVCVRVRVCRRGTE